VAAETVIAEFRVGRLDGIPICRACERYHAPEEGHRH
jgi:hypothetical protein